MTEKWGGMQGKYDLVWSGDEFKFFEVRAIEALLQ